MAWDERWIFRLPRLSTFLSIANGKASDQGSPVVELLRRGVDVSYYRTASGREVDFACRRGRALSELVQVTLSLADPQVRQRELDALTEAMKEQKVEVGSMLTESEHEDITSGRRTIRVRPLPAWLCGLTD